ncbi:pentapeptide repeat-containing protein [Acaryochloris sp. CCMEE 5410]|uniref:pentapeptide repeat-containing protein n=1 Tax=Acaryochloris sp. CCMEE 5410 TaxID=310037 RepID=UPI000584EEFE|nr:pentapeptide repeat-containing protein [Acaryochloris sp. CCMEE 5410]KAI9134128.1 pentapeptide repeat-containing protein [Acaryochloris sp. CCMEE 5410]
MAKVHKWSNRNLRNRSFRGQNLQQANFSGSDLRGCSFDLAQLQGANFDRARVGYGPESILIGLLVVIDFVGLAFYAMSQMLFGALGLTSEISTYPYLLALLGFLASAGISSAIFPSRKRVKPIAALTTGALLGFFYGGVMLKNDPQAAVLMACVGGVFSLGMSVMARTRLVTVAIYTVGGCAAYGVCFFSGTRASSLLNVQQLVAGIAWSLLCLVFLGITLQVIANLVTELKDFAHTSWRGADLSDVNLDGIQLDSYKRSRYGLHNEQVNAREPVKSVSSG